MLRSVFLKNKIIKKYFSYYCKQKLQSSILQSSIHIFKTYFGRNVLGCLWVVCGFGNRCEEQCFYIDISFNLTYYCHYIENFSISECLIICDDYDIHLYWTSCGHLKNYKTWVHSISNEINTKIQYAHMWVGNKIKNLWSFVNFSLDTVSTKFWLYTYWQPNGWTFSRDDQIMFKTS